MPLLPPLITCTPNAQPLYAPVSGGGGGGQVLSQTGNTVSLSGGGGSVDIASTTLVADTAQKTTALTYNGGLLSTSIVGDLFVERTEVGTPLTPQPLTVNGTLDVVIDPTGFVRLTNLGSVLPAGQNVLYIDPILGTVGQGGAPASTWVGTATSDLNMAGYNINTASAVGIKSDTGVLEFKNSAGVSKGSLAYNEADGDIHLFAEDTLDLTANNAVDVTAINGDVTLATNTTDIYVNSARGISMTGATTGVSITAGTSGNVSATANAGNIVLTANQDPVGNGGDLNFSTSLGGSITSLSGNIALSCASVTGTIDLTSPFINASAGNVVADATTEIQLKIGGAIQASLAGGGNIGVGGNASDGSVFLIKSNNSSYGALNYNGTNDTLNVDNGGSGISVGASGITMTPQTEVTITTPLATIANPMLVLESSSTVAGATNGTPVIKTNKTGRNAVSNDTVMSQQFNALNFNGVETTFGKIECVATTATVGDNDGALDFYSLINGVNQRVMRLNGADNENNSFRPLDLNGFSLKTSTGDLTIDASTTSTLSSKVIINTKDFVTPGLGDRLVLNGNSLLNGSAGGNSGQHLCLTINGTVYKIALLNV